MGIYLYRKPSAKAPVIHAVDEAPFLVWGRGERTASGEKILDPGGKTWYA